MEMERARKADQVRPGSDTPGGGTYAQGLAKLSPKERALVAKYSKMTPEQRGADKDARRASMLPHEMIARKKTK